MLIYIYGILALGALVVVHELGHFLVAKFFNVGVLEFSIGFGKKIWRKKIGETTYAIGLIPLGGYVRMIGDDPSAFEEQNCVTPEVVSGDDATSKNGGTQNPSDILESIDKESPEYKALYADRSRWFLTQGFIPKSLIVLAGPLFNIGFALVLSFAVHLIYGRPDITTVGGKPEIGEVVPNFPAAKAGLQADDTVLSIDGKKISNWVEIASTIAASEGKALVFVVERRTKEQAAGTPGQVLTITVAGTLDNEELTALDEPTPGKEKEVAPKRHMIGISASFDRVPVTALEAATIAPQHVWYITKMTVKSLVALVSGVISPKHIAGPIYIFGEAARTAERGWDSLFTFLILLNISLAVFNLLPIPVLDGGHLLFFIIGALKGQPVSIKVQQLASQIGMVLLLGLMLFAVSNDILRFLL